MINEKIRKHVKPCKFLGFVINTESFFNEFNDSSIEGRKKLSDAVLIFSRAMEIANFQVKRGCCRDIEKRSDKLPSEMIDKYNSFQAFLKKYGVSMDGPYFN